MTNQVLYIFVQQIKKYIFFYQVLYIFLFKNHTRLAISITPQNVDVGCRYIVLFKILIPYSFIQNFNPYTFIQNVESQVTGPFHQYYNSSAVYVNKLWIYILFVLYWKSHSVHSIWV